MASRERIVRTQAELDRAIADGADWIEIRSPHGVWLTVRAHGSATVTAYESATVRAYGSATVTASGSATVTAYDSATVRASGSATVTAHGSATVTAYGSATVRASSHVAIHLHSGYVRTEGGVVIDHLAVDQLDPATWCSYHGVEVIDGKAKVYKAVRTDLRSSHGTRYDIGSTVTCSDWLDNHACGDGLHFGPTPSHAVAYDDEASRYLACHVDLTSLRPITDGGTAKCKAPSVEVLYEVDLFGRQIRQQSQQAEEIQPFGHRGL